MENIINMFENDLEELTRNISYEEDHRYNFPSLSELVTMINKYDNFFGKQFASVAQFKNKANIPIFEKGLNSNDKEIKKISILALGKLKANSAIPKLIDYLYSNDNMIRLYAIHALGEIKDTEAMPHLMSLLNTTEEPLTKKEIILALGKIKEPIAVLPIMELLENKEYLNTALEALGNIADPIAFDSIIKYYNYPDHLVRANVAIALGNFQNKKSIEILRILLQDNSNLVVSSAALSLGKLKDLESLENIIFKFLENRFSINILYHSVYNYGKIALEKLDKSLIDIEDYDFKMVVIKILSYFKYPKSLNTLIKFFQEEYQEHFDDIKDDFIDIFLIEELLGAFKQYGTASIIPIIYKATRSKYPSIKNLARETFSSALAALKKKDIEIVTKLLKNEDFLNFLDSDLLKEFFETIYNVFNKDLELEIFNLANSNNLILKKEAGLYLAKCGNKKAIALLTEILNNENISNSEAKNIEQVINNLMSQND